MLISDVFPDGRSLMFFNAALIQVSACVADIIRITQITLKMVNNAMLVNNRGFAFFWPDVRSDLSGCAQRGLCCSTEYFVYSFKKVFCPIVI